MTDPADCGFHRAVPVRDLPAAGRPFAIEATAEECAQLACWLGLIAVERLVAEGRVMPRADGHEIVVEGSLHAQVVQTCVVSLDPLPAAIDAPVERLFTTTIADEWAMYEADAPEIYVDLEDDLVAEPLPAGGLDLGAVVAEQLWLELDPFPRRADAVLDLPEQPLDREQPVAGENPAFRALRRRWPGGPD